MSTLYNEWLEYAERDLQSAKFLCGMYPVPIEIICYLCHQAAEKFLKAVLIANDIEPPKTHDIVKIKNLCSEYADMSSITDDCSSLNPYATGTRYPALLSITENDMQRAIQSAERIMEFIKKILKDKLGIDLIYV